MKQINTNDVISKYNDGLSCAEIADSYGTYPKKIERLLKKHGVTLRSRSDATKGAMKKGRLEHPTRGKIRTEAEREAISKGVEKSWQEMDELDRKAFSDAAKKRWDKIDPLKKREMQEKAGRALRISSIEGSKAEKFLKKKLNDLGYQVVMHKKGLVQGNFEIDLLLPELNTIIEIDGPQHFLPIFGEEKLQNVVKMDNIKNGLLIGKGFCIVRLKYLCKSMNKSVERKIWSAVSEQIKNIEKKFPPVHRRLIELEIK